MDISRVDTAPAGDKAGTDACPPRLGAAGVDGPETGGERWRTWQVTLTWVTSMPTGADHANSPVASCSKMHVVNELTDDVTVIDEEDKDVYRPRCRQLERIVVAMDAVQCLVRRSVAV
jgi:hypothetical protein